MCVCLLLWNRFKFVESGKLEKDLMEWKVSVKECGLNRTMSLTSLFLVRKKLKPLQFFLDMITILAKIEKQ